MKIVVIGGTGLIGSKLVAKPRDHGHDAVAAALPNVNTLTGEGLAEAMSGADVVEALLRRSVAGAHAAAR